MQEILYLEVPTPATADVQAWLQTQFQPTRGQVIASPSGIRWQFSDSSTELSVLAWSLQRTTYLKVFRWGLGPVPGESALIQHLKQSIQAAFPLQYHEPPQVDLSKGNIFSALEPFYPRTVKYFQQMPNGEADLQRVYWWEQRWRDGVRNPQAPQQVISQSDTTLETLNYDLIYIGGALGVIHAAVMARLGYRVLLLERLPFGRMNREWNISRAEFQHLIDLGLFTAAEFETIIAREYRDGFNKFFSATTPKHCQAPILHTPTVLNIAVDSSQLLELCGQKLRQAGGEIWDETEFLKGTIHPNGIKILAQDRSSQDHKTVTARLLVDAMGTASPIAWQLNGGRAFDSVCPTVGALISGLAPQVWDANYGDVLNSHGDLSRGRQLIWELFPVAGDNVTIYLFHYHKVHPENPGSLLEMYEDFFHILPEYRRCDLDELNWIKPTFGYIPGHFSLHSQDRTTAFDRLVTIGDAASLQSPLVFTGFGSLVRNLPRLTDLLNTALKHDLLQSQHLNQIRAFQSNTAVTWLFSRGMMVPTGRNLPPNRVNAMLNTFFGILAGESPELADRFIKDRAGWWPFNRMALTAAWKNPGLLYWIWDMVGAWDMTRWMGSYFTFTWAAFLNGIFGAWLPGLIRKSQAWLEPQFPELWFWLLCRSYDLTYSVGQPRIEQKLPTLTRPGTALSRPMVTVGEPRFPSS